jgi:hypothetical protein
MRLKHPTIPIGLLIAGVLVLGLAGRIEGAAAASDCPCIRGRAGACVPDLVCEARERQMRDRLMHNLGEHQVRTAPQSGTAMDHRRERARPSTTAAPAPTTAPVPTTAAPTPPAAAPVRRNSPAMDYREPMAAPVVTRPAPPPTGGGATPPTDAPVLPGDFTTRGRSLRPAADTATVSARPGSTSGAGRLRILETGYSHLSELGKEEEGYGLYSYAILPSESRRAAIFLSQLFREIPSIGETGAQRSQLNIFYVPLKKDRENEFATLIQASGANSEKMGAEYSRSFYDYKIARALLNHVCNPPAASIRRLCDGDLSIGPYIFTYASPASSMSSVPPPYLFVDLSDVHSQAFGELIAAFRSQLKRDDISDQARIRTLRLMILDIALTAADWVNPVEKAIADIVHSPSADEKK